MIKPPSLRDHLTRHVPHLKADPTRLHMQVLDGHVACRRTGSLTYRYHYTLELLVMDFPGHADALVVPLLAWLAANEPDLLSNPDSAAQAMPFKAEWIDKDHTDLEFRLALTEAVVVTKTAKGHKAEHLPEPNFDETGVAPWRIFLAGDEITPG